MNEAVTRWLMRLFPKGGYYVEAGAHDGVGDSHTYTLERTGLWQGLCVEPSTAYAGLRRSRTCRTDNRCLWLHNGGVVYRLIRGADVELSGIPQTFRDGWDRETRPHEDSFHPSVTLTTLLHEHSAPPVIEALCLDTEGSELTILGAHDFSRYTFLAIVVEHNGGEAYRADLYTFLSSLEYKRIGNDGVNDWYTAPGIRDSGE